jgi:hypothetical protein
MGNCASIVNQQQLQQVQFIQQTAAMQVVQVAPAFAGMMVPGSPLVALADQHSSHVQHIEVDLIPVNKNGRAFLGGGNVPAFYQITPVLDEPDRAPAQVPIVHAPAPVAAVAAANAPLPPAALTTAPAPAPAPTPTPTPTPAVSPIGHRLRVRRTAVRVLTPHPPAAPLFVLQHGRKMCTLRHYEQHASSGVAKVVSDASPAPRSSKEKEEEEKAKVETILPSHICFPSGGMDLFPLGTIHRGDAAANVASAASATSSSTPSLMTLDFLREPRDDNLVGTHTSPAPITNVKKFF